MFEIPDDDDNFWTSIPMDEISCSNRLIRKENQPRPQLRIPESGCTGNGAKQLCNTRTEDNIYERDLRDQVSNFPTFNPSPLNQSIDQSNSRILRAGVASSTHNTTNQKCETPKMTSVSARVVSPMVTPIRDTAVSGGMHRRNAGVTVDSPSGSDFVTPKRRRKFPGPAGVLPKLTPDQSLDMLSACSTPNSTPGQRKSPQEEPALLSSQTSEDVFSDTAWQTLLSDMGEDGVKVMKKFSIATTLLKAGKKQLNQGKAGIIFGVIESIESHGSEASVTIKDKSGKMQGTVHRDLMKEYDGELQVGTVMVLKQVSIISLSARNHYLNITPTNVIMLYLNRQGSLKSLKFYNSQDSLRSVLAALEKKAGTHCTNGSMTPSSLTASSRVSETGSSTNTPILRCGTPSTPVLNQRLFNSGTPSTSNCGTPTLNINQRHFNNGTPLSSNRSVMCTTQPAVRDVSVINRNNSNNSCLSSKSNNNSFQIQPNFLTPKTKISERNNIEDTDQTQGISRLGQNNPLVKTLRTANNVTLNNNGNISPVRSKNTALGHVINPEVNTGVSISDETSERFCAKTSDNSHEFTSNTAPRQQWKFKSPMSTPVRLTSRLSPNVMDLNVDFGSNQTIAQNSNLTPSVTGRVNNNRSGDSSGRSCQLTTAETTMRNSKSHTNCNNPDVHRDNVSSNNGKSRWAFKSRGLSSPQTLIVQKENVEKVQYQAADVTDNPGDNEKHLDDIWEDDLSDELLSQLSDEMT